MDLYIARCATWEWHNASQIDIVDANGNVLVTLDEWQTLIFHEADGGRTVRNLLTWRASHYCSQSKPKPPDLDQTVLNALTVLVEEMRVVELCQEGPVLPDKLLTPWSEWEEFGIRID